MFDRIHEPTSSTQADTDFVTVHCHQDDRNYRFVCHQHRDVVVTHVSPYTSPSGSAVYDRERIGFRKRFRVEHVENVPPA